MTVAGATSLAAETNQRPSREIRSGTLLLRTGLHSMRGHHNEPRKNMFPGARDVQLCYNEARVCATVRRAKQRVYITPFPKEARPRATRAREKEETREEKEEEEEEGERGKKKKKNKEKKKEKKTQNHQKNKSQVGQQIIISSNVNTSTSSFSNVNL